MTTGETAGSRLLNLLQHLQEWSSTLGAIQIRILTEGIAGLYRQMVDGLQLDEGLMGHVQPSTSTGALPPEALLQIARMTMVCEDAPVRFLEDHDAEGLFESLIRQFSQLRSRIELEVSASAWQFYTRLHELEALSRSMDSPQIVETVRLIMVIYMKVISSLMLDESKFEEVSVPEGWFSMTTGETRKLAARLVAICLEPGDYLNPRIPRTMHEERFRLETRRISGFLAEVGTKAQ